MDGGLRKLCQLNMPDVHFQSIETGGTGRGVPDINFCFDGIEGWIECKLTQANAVGMRPEQVGWIERRRRAGGRVFIAVRVLCTAGKRREQRDELHLFKGEAARDLKIGGLKAAKKYRLAIWEGGPGRWPWAQVKAHLRNAY